jgi:hypothetical protein
MLRQQLGSYGYRLGSNWNRRLGHRRYLHCRMGEAFRGEANTPSRELMKAACRQKRSGGAGPGCGESLRSHTRVRPG